MEVLLREVRDGPGGIAAGRDTELSTKEVSIGCAPDQQVQLLGRTVGARHAVIRGGSGGPSLICLAGLRATVNGDEKRSARLDIGDRIEIGGHRLIITQPPAGFDLAIELHPSTKIDRSDFEAAFRTDLQQTWLGKRSTTWLLIAFTASFAFVIPFWTVRARRGDRPLPAWVPAALPTDVLWSTGPLAPAHQQLMGERCAACHQTLWTRVQDGACKSCHQNTGDHVGPSRLSQTSFGSVQGCASCHREHGETTGHLTDRADRVCIGCHAKAPDAFGTLKVQAVSGFGAGRHPPFAANLQLEDVEKGRTGLKFSHSQHLDGGRVRGGNRGPLGCADCHKLSTDGVSFEPTTMAGNCVSCHELTFDPEAPDRQLPHGKPREIVRALQDYFARKLVDPKGARGEAPERRRLPGQEDEAGAQAGQEKEERHGNCAGSTYTCAMQMAAREVQVEFERRGCVTCHQVKDTRNKDLAERFQVEPIRLLNDYFPAARFPHRSHLIQGGVAGDGACLSCHPANRSQARDLMLPDLPTCLGCHTDTPARNRTSLQCVSCHAYHPHS